MFELKLLKKSHCERISYLCTSGIIPIQNMYYMCG